MGVDITRLRASERLTAAKEGRCIIAIHAWGWGKGKTIGEAYDASRKNGGGGRCVIYDAPADAVPNEFGGIDRADDEAPSYILYRIIPTAPKKRSRIC